MAKKFRRGMSLLLALILIAGQLTTPVLAAEENTTETTTTVPAPDQGTPTTTTDTTTTTDDKGNTTTTTTTTTTGGGVDAQSKETYTSDAIGANQSLTTESQSTTTDVGDTSVTTTTNENGDKVKEVSEQSTTVTDEKGESQQTQSVEPQGDGTEKASGTDTGSSEKTETTTTTTTTEEYDQLLSDTTTDNITNNNPNPLTPDDSEKKVEGDNTDLPENSSELGAGTEWTDGDVTEGSTVVDDPNKENSSTTTDYTFGTPDNPEVTLGNPVKQADGTTLVTATVAINGLEKLMEMYPAEDGWKVDPYMVNGEQVGWKATKIEETPDFQDDSGDLTATGKETVKEAEHVTKTNVPLESYEEQIKNNPVVETPVSMDGGLETGKEVKTYEKVYQVDENGNQVLDADGNPIFVGYKVTTTVTTEKDISDTGVIPTNDPSYAGPAVPDVDIFELPQKPDESTTTDADGNVTTVTVEPLMENGVQTGWTIHTAFTSADGDAIRNETKNIYAKTGTETTAIEKDPVTEQTIVRQLRTYTTVEMVTADEWSKTMSVEMSKDQSSQTEIFTEEELYALSNGGKDDFVFTYEGRFYVVQASTLTDLKEGVNVNTNNAGITDEMQVASPGTVSTNKADYQNYKVVVLDANGNPARDANGNLIFTTISNADLRFQYEDYVTGTTSNPVTKEVSDYYTGQVITGNGNWDGYGLFGSFVVYDEANKARHTPRMFTITIGGQKRYAYCVELGADLFRNNSYQEVIYGDGEGQTADGDNKPYSGAQGDIANLRKVAVNGYWGTESGLGSLQAVKDLMARNGIGEEYYENLTPGMALVATQMAVWQYGNSNKAVDFLDANGNVLVTWDETTSNGTMTQHDKDTIEKLWQLLINIADNDNQNAAEKITADSITGSSITVHQKQLNDDGTAKTGTHGGELYDADVAFKMDVSTSSINGDLVLKVTDATGKVHKYRLAGNDSESIFDDFVNRLHPDANGVYTITGVTMENGQKIDVKIQGIQDIDDGIYIYRSTTQSGNNSQDFIGLSKQQYTVALDFQVDVSVDDPVFQHTSNDTHQLRTDTRQQTTNVDQVYTWKMEKVDAEGAMTQNLTNRRIIRGTVTTTKTLTEQVKEELYWEAYYEYLLTTTTGDGGFGGGGGNGGPGGNAIIIPDEQVPLAVAPATGDVSYLWAAVSVLSLAAYFILSRKPKMI